MKRKLTLAFATLMAMSALATPIYAADAPSNAPNYNYSTGYKSDQWGSPTTSEVTPDNTATQNVRRDKNAAYYPPSYGVFSGEIPSNPTNPYITQDANKSSVSQVNAPTSGVDTSSSGTGTAPYGASDVNVPPTYPMSTGAGTGSNAAPSTGSNGKVTVSYSNIGQGQNQIMTVTPYNDGSIGTVSIPRFKLNVKVFEGVDLPTLREGVGHFPSTSQWDGNCGFAAHNRGSYDYFNCIKDINIGDTVTYTTQMGTRTYKVFSKQKILETDMSYLGYTDENIVSLFTCVINDPPYRWCVQAREVK